MTSTTAKGYTLIRCWTQRCQQLPTTPMADTAAKQKKSTSGDITAGATAYAIYRQPTQYTVYCVGCRACGDVAARSSNTLLVETIKI
eukprot:4079184-Pleurochrysis_carterae.AAC.1